MATLLCVASLQVGVAWDESIYFAFSDSVRRWVAAGPAFDRASILQAWAYSPYHNPHPPFPKAMSALTAAALDGALPFPAAYRLAYHLYIGAALSVVYLLLRPAYGRLLALAAVAFVLLQPRVFGDMLIATTDASVAMGWLVVSLAAWRIAAAPAGVSARVPRIVMVSFYGFAVATKFTGALVLLPAGAYLLLRSRLRETPFVAATGLYGLAFLVATSPEKWLAPVASVVEYLVYPLTRQKIPMTVYFLGTSYIHPPWTYFAVLSLVTYPVALWLLLAGLARLRREERELCLAVAVPLLFWLVLVHLPTTPRHDGVRQFLAVYPLLTLLAWTGFRRVVDEAARHSRARHLRPAAVVAMAAILALGVWRSHPHELAYYNAFVGGIRGAEASGMEMCYFLECVDPPFVRALNQNVSAGSRVSMAPYWPELLATYQRHGLLRTDFTLQPEDAGPPDLLVYVRRRSRINDATYRALPALHETTYDGVSLAKLVRPVK